MKNGLTVILWGWWRLACSRCNTCWSELLISMVRWRHLLRRRGRKAPWSWILLHWGWIHLAWVCSRGWRTHRVALIPVWHLSVGTMALSRNTRWGICASCLRITLPPRGCCWYTRGLRYPLDYTSWNCIVPALVTMCLKDKLNFIWCTNQNRAACVT